MKDKKQWISEVFDRAAPYYGKKSSDFFNYFGEKLVEQVEVKPHHHVLDVATGRGAVLFPLTKTINTKGQITGIDISKQMICETSSELLKKGIDYVKLLHMDAESLDFPESSFDFIFCGFCLFFFPSISKALAGFKRVLKPGGSLVFSIWLEDSKLDKLINSEIDRINPIDRLATLSTWDAANLQKLCEEAGFHEVRTHEENKKFIHETCDEWWQSLWSHATRSKLENLPPDQLEKCYQNMLEKTAQHNKGGPLEEELKVLYGVAKA